MRWPVLKQVEVTATITDDTLILDVHLEVGQFNLQIEELTKEIGEKSDALTETRAQRNNESLANAATVSTTQEGLDALEFVIEQLSQFYKTSAKATVEMTQYAPDSAYKDAQEEWTEIMLSVIQLDFERTTQETHAAEEGSARSFILAERNYEATISTTSTAPLGKGVPDHEVRHPVQERSRG